MSDPIILTIISIIVLLAFSGFFSGSETALTGASRPRMHQLESDGNKRARIVNLLHAQQERLIGGILIGNNIVNILASALATSLMITLFGDSGVIYATVAMTILVVIFSEVLPKTYAIRHADDVALTVGPIIRAMIIVLTPISKTVEIIVDVLLRLLGERVSSAEDEAREEELRGAIRLHSDTNTVNAHEGQMLGGVMDLDDIEVGEIMTHRTDVEHAGCQSAARRDPDPGARLALLPAVPTLQRRSRQHRRRSSTPRPCCARSRSTRGISTKCIVAAPSLTEPWFVPESTDCH